MGSHEESRKRLTGVFVLTGTALALHGLYQSLLVFGPDAAAAVGDISEAVRARIASGRAVSTMGLPGVLGGFLALSLPLTAGWLRRDGKLRVWVLVLLLVQAAGLIATRSAAAVVSLAAAAGIVVWLRGRPGSSMAKPGRRRLAFGLVATGVLVAALLLAVRFSSPGAADEGSGPFSLRAGNWKVAMKIFEENPILGSGLGTYGIAFPAHREWGMNEARHAHNSYLQAFSEGGAALGLPLLIAVALFLVPLRSVARGAEPWLAVASYGFLLHNMMDFTFFIESTGIGFACVAGLLIGTTLRRSGAMAAQPHPGFGKIGIYALCSMLALFALLTRRADAARAQARELVVAQRHEEALEAAQVAAARNPFDPVTRSLLSHLWLDLSVQGGREALANAEEEAVVSVSLDPHTPHHWSHLARVRLTRGDVQGAYVAAAHAAELYPIEIRYREERDAIAAALQAADQVPQ